jgi:hypothetical protein
MKTYTVYKLTSPSGKVYVGWTGRPLKKRMQDHLSEMRRGFTRPIQHALRKYPLETRQQDIILETTDYQQSIVTEVDTIRMLDSTNPNKGYNLSSGGQYGASGVIRTDKNKESIRQGKKRSTWRSTPEHGAKISAALKGHPPSDKQKQATIKARAKTYNVRFPDGHVEEVYNLHAFCKQRGLCSGNLSSSSSKGFRLHK